MIRESYELVPGVTKERILNLKVSREDRYRKATGSLPMLEEVASPSTLAAMEQQGQPQATIQQVAQQTWSSNNSPSCPAISVI